LVSEAAKRSDKLGGFIAALPLITFMALIWLYIEKQPEQKIANHAWYTFWYVLPTLPMFLVFPALLSRLGFWPALLSGAVITVLCFALFAWALRPLGIELL
jgi:F0F1-type ATP synthase assembly protein I